MRNIAVLVATLLVVAAANGQDHPSLPSSFRAGTIHSPEGAEIFVRSGGRGPVVVLLHGYENSDSWAPLAADLMKDHTVVVPVLRGIGLCLAKTPLWVAEGSAIHSMALRVAGQLARMRFPQDRVTSSLRSAQR